MPTLILSVHEAQEVPQVPVPVPTALAFTGNCVGTHRATVPFQEQQRPPKKRGRRPLVQDEDQRKARRKAQCKQNQRRYRARQRGLICMLSLETTGLKDYVGDLQDYRDFVRDYCLVPPAPWHDDPRPLRVVDHFFRVFRTGFALHSLESSALQERFVRLVCAPEVVALGATADGVEALLLQLKRYASYHGTLEVRPQSVHMVHAPWHGRHAGAHDETRTWIVEAKGAMRMQMSRDTLMLVYPHVLRHHDALAQRVVGHTIEPAFTLTFQFDTRATVTQLDQRVDFAGAFLRLLQSADDVATLLHGALISPFSELGLDPHGTTTASALTRGSKPLCLKFILV